jgi:hypothetical protein
MRSRRSLASRTRRASQRRARSRRYGWRADLRPDFPHGDRTGSSVPSRIAGRRPALPMKACLPMQNASVMLTPRFRPELLSQPGGCRASWPASSLSPPWTPEYDRLHTADP